MDNFDKKRSDLLDRLADHVLTHGLAASSLRPLAKAAETSDRMLLYYFEDKDAIIGAVLQQIAARMVTMMGAQAAPEPLPYDALMARILATLEDDRFWPYMRVWLEAASRAANGDVTLRTIGEAVGRGFLAWGRAQLLSDNPDRDAARLLVTIEGTVFLRAIGMADVCAAAVSDRLKMK
jgi:AcrR family transcriptional regulator